MKKNTHTNTSCHNIERKKRILFSKGNIKKALEKEIVIINNLLGKSFFLYNLIRKLTQVYLYEEINIYIYTSNGFTFEFKSRS